MPVSSIYSKQILQKRIVKLQEMFTALGEQDRKRKEELAKSNYEEKKKEEFIDPNFLFSHRMSKLGSLYLSQKPKNHAIGDQVICIAPEFFGHFGVVIGINDTIY